MKPGEIHPQQQRENPEPQEGSNPMPWFVIVLTALLLGFGVLYIAQSAIVSAPAMGDGRSTDELQGAAPVAVGAAVDGAAVYASRCVACHQASGAGLPGVFPPLAGNGVVVAPDPANILKVVLGGVPARGGYIPMPGFAGQLNDAQIADIANYVRSNWGNAAPTNATPQQVSALRRALPAAPSGVAAK